MKKSIALILAVISIILILPSCKKQNSLTKAKVGDVVKFGTYEQNVPDNGKEDIEWIILKKEKDKALIISKYTLDCKPYNEEYKKTTWEKCTLRNWLNSDFFNNSFTKEEKAKILTTTVKADKNPSFPDTNPGKDTKDKIFLLSTKEAEKYFSSDDKRKCEATYYATEKGVSTSNKDSSDGKETCWWWLRSSGFDKGDASGVNPDGFIGDGSSSVNYDRGGVRPAMWVLVK